MVRGLPNQKRAGTFHHLPRILAAIQKWPWLPRAGRDMEGDESLGMALAIKLGAKQHLLLVETCVAHSLHNRTVVLRQGAPQT